MKDIVYAEKNSGDLLKNVWFFLKKYNGITKTYNQFKILFTGKARSDSLKDLESLDGAEKLEKVLFACSIIGLFTLPLDFGSTIIQSIVAILINRHIDINRNVTFASQPERVRASKRMIQTFDEYIRGFEDVLRQARSKKDDKMIYSCEKVIEELKIGREEFIRNNNAS